MLLNSVSTLSGQVQPDPDIGNTVRKMARLNVIIFILSGILIGCGLLWKMRETSAATEQFGNFVIRGTLNVALANANGFVVVKDSRLTAVNGTEMHPLPDPGKKLFQLDGRTVCTFAGFASEKFETAPEFNTSAAGIIERFQQELTQQSDPRSFLEKLTSLSFLFNFYLSSVANIDQAVQGSTPTQPQTYTLQLLLAGYDTDGTPKLGKLILRTAKEHGRDGQPIFSSVTENLQEVPVNNKLVYLTAGQDDVALGILKNPNDFRNDPTIRKYAELIATDEGSSLTLPEMKQLAEALVRYTEKKYPTVGGPRQLSFLQSGKVISIEQPNFPKHSLPLPGFNLVVGNHFEGRGGIVFGGQPIGLFVKNYFRHDVRILDGHYFFGNEFVDSELRYDGGLTRFDRSNKVVGSTLVIGAHAEQHPDVVQYLKNNFPWQTVHQEQQKEQRQK